MFEDKPNRETWKFNYRSSDIVAACSHKLEYHKSRENHWREEFKKAEENLRTQGISIDTIPDLPAFNNSYKQEVSIDQKILKEVRDAQSKINEHITKQKEYNKYYRALLSRNMSLELTVDDLDFFGMLEEPSN
jgi:hypothetical protein